MYGITSCQKISISPYSSRDQKSVKELILNGLKEFGFTYSAKFDSDLEDPSIYIKNGGMFYVLKDNEKIVGTVAIINRGNVGELKRMYVDKHYQGKGYWSLLFKNAIEFCKQKKYKKLEFETNKKFKKGHVFYKNKGCRIVREDERSYYMEKKLI